MESVSDALKRLADGASCEGFPTDARELREVEKRVAELIAADEEYDAALKIHKALRDGISTLGEVFASEGGLHRASARRAAALLACKGQDHER